MLDGQKRQGMPWDDLGIYTAGFDYGRLDPSRDLPFPPDMPSSPLKLGFAS